MKPAPPVISTLLAMGPHIAAAEGSPGVPQRGLAGSPELPAHLGLPDPSVLGRDGHLTHAKSLLQRMVRQFFPEPVAGAVDGAEVRRLEKFPPKALESPGRVAHLEAKDGGVKRAPD